MEIKLPQKSLIQHLVSLWFSAPYLFGLESRPSSETNVRIVKNAESIKDNVIE